MYNLRWNVRLLLHSLCFYYTDIFLPSISFVINQTWVISYKVTLYIQKHFPLRRHDLVTQRSRSKRSKVCVTLHTSRRLLGILREMFLVILFLCKLILGGLHVHRIKPCDFFFSRGLNHDCIYPSRQQRRYAAITKEINMILRSMVQKRFGELSKKTSKLRRNWSPLPK